MRYTGFNAAIFRVKIAADFTLWAGNKDWQ